MDIRPIDANALWRGLSLGPERADHFVALKCVRSGIEAAPTLSLNTLRDEIYNDAVAHGLWEDFDKFFDGIMQSEEVVADTKRYDCATSIHRECDELVNAFFDEDHFVEELADVIIMSMSVAGKLGIDIDAAIRRKMEINKQGPWKHGKENSFEESGCTIRRV